MNYFKDFIQVNKEALIRTIKQLYFVPILALIIIIMNVSEEFVLSILEAQNMGVNFILGFIRFIVKAIFMSAIISILSDIVLYERFSFKSVLSGYKTYITQVSNTLFFLVIIEYLAYFLFRAVPSGLLMTIYSFLILFLYSSLYESIYIGDAMGYNAVILSLKFIKDNILQWVPIMLVYAVLESLFNIKLIIYYFDFEIILKSVIISILLAFVYIFKGNLYNILYGSSVRKRLFQGKF